MATPLGEKKVKSAVAPMGPAFVELMAEISEAFRTKNTELLKDLRTRVWGIHKVSGDLDRLIDGGLDQVSTGFEDKTWTNGVERIRAKKGTAVKVSFIDTI